MEKRARGATWNRSRALAQRVPLGAECPGGVGDSPAPAGAVGGRAGLPTAAPGRWPRRGRARVRPCPRGVPGRRAALGCGTGPRRALAAAASAAEHVPGRRGQGRCSEARGTFPAAPPPGEPVARRGAAARRSPRLPGGEAARAPCSEAGCGRRRRRCWRCSAPRCSRSARRPPGRTSSGRRGPGAAASGPRSCWSSCTGGWRPACSAPSTTPCSPSRRAASTTPAAPPGHGRPPTRGSGSPSTCAAHRPGLTGSPTIPRDTLSTFPKPTACAKAACWGSLARRACTSAAPRCSCPPSSCAARPPAPGAATSTPRITSPSPWAAPASPSRKRRHRASIPASISKK